MKNNTRFIFFTMFGLLAFVLSGCASVKEIGKGFIGESTRVLEQKRSAALKKSFALGYDDCYVKVKNILNSKGKEIDIIAKDNEPYIYAEDLKKKMIAIYLSSTDTTPVGIFFTEKAGSNTLIEISSPSIYAKEEIANRIFGGLAAGNQIQKEKNADGKEKISN